MMCVANLLTFAHLADLLRSTEVFDLDASPTLVRYARLAPFPSAAVDGLLFPLGHVDICRWGVRAVELKFDAESVVLQRTDFVE